MQDETIRALLEEFAKAAGSEARMQVKVDHERLSRVVFDASTAVSDRFTIDVWELEREHGDDLGGFVAAMAAKVKAEAEKLAQAHEAIVDAWQERLGDGSRYGRVV